MKKINTPIIMGAVAAIVASAGLLWYAAAMQGQSGTGNRISVNTAQAASNVTVTWGNTHQTIDGFGGSDASGNDPLRANLPAAQMQFFYGTNPATSIGLTLLRTQVPATGVCTSVQSSCAGTNITDMQNAIADSGGAARIWSTSFSPPAAYKSNGSTSCSAGSGSGALNAGSYAAYGTYLTNYVKSLQQFDGINLYALSPQNEPDWCPSYEGALWSAGDFDTFIKSDLGPDFSAAGLNTLIVFPEASVYSHLGSEASTCMTDSSCSQYVGVLAWHDYDDASSVPAPYSAPHYWETEASAFPGAGPSLNGGNWDPSMADGLLWGGILDNRLAVGNATAWNWWALAVGNPGTTDNELLIGGPTNNIVPKRTYVLGQYSLFVRPGMVRIDATHNPASGVDVSAYKNPSTGAFAIVAINTNGSSAPLTFSLSGFTANSVTPYETSASDNLAQLASIATTGGNTLNTTLDADSVVTFVGTNGGGGSPPPSGDTTPPSIPTGLSATAASASEIDLSWTASTDNVGVTGYNIFRNGTQITTTAGTSYSDTTVSPSTQYSYTVAAYDAAGNTSNQSSASSATTPAGSGNPAPPTGNGTNSQTFNPIFANPGTYQLTCTDSAGNSTSTDITVTADCSIAASPTAVVVPGQSTITWSCVPGTATAVNIVNQQTGAVTNVCNSAASCTSGTLSVAPTQDTTYELLGSANNGSNSPMPTTSVNVTVQGPGVIEGNPGG